MLTITMHRAIRNCKHAKVNLRRTTDDPCRGAEEGGRKILYSLFRLSHLLIKSGYESKTKIAVCMVRGVTSCVTPCRLLCT